MICYPLLSRKVDRQLGIDLCKSKKCNQPFNQDICARNSCRPKQKCSVTEVGASCAKKWCCPDSGLRCVTRKFRGRKLGRKDRRWRSRRWRKTRTRRKRKIRRSRDRTKLVHRCEKCETEPGKRCGGGSGIKCCLPMFCINRQCSICGYGLEPCDPTNNINCCPGSQCVSGKCTFSERRRKPTINSIIMLRGNDRERDAEDPEDGFSGEDERDEGELADTRTFFL